MSAEITRNNFDKIEKDNVKLPKKLFELAVKILLENESFRSAASEAFILNYPTAEFVQGDFTYKVEIGSGLTSDHKIDQVDIKKSRKGNFFEAIHIGITYEDFERKHAKYSSFGLYTLNRYGTIIGTEADPYKVRKFLQEINLKPVKNS